MSSRETFLLGRLLGVSISLPKNFEAHLLELMRLRALLGMKEKSALGPRGSDPRAWRNARSDDGARSWPTSEFLAEHHHHLYGRPWAIGRGYFDFLLEDGLRPSDSVLDFGCGAGRVGIWLIPFLDAGNYVGVDNHRYAIEAFRGYEVPLHNLAAKGPEVLLDGSGEPHRLNRRFDVILDLWVTRHFAKEDAVRAYRSFARALKEGGRIVTNEEPLVAESELADLGLHVVRRERRPNWKRDDYWHIIVKR